MKTNKKHRPLLGKHCINLYFDQNNEDAGCFILGSYEAFKPMLIAAAMENPTFGRAFLDAALEYADMLLGRDEKGGNHD